MISNKQSTRHYRTDTGFTLVEVMVALAIMAIIVTVAFSGLTIGMNSWERGSRAIDDLDRRATIERLLKRQLALALPMEFNFGEQKAVLFRGSSNRLEFVSDYSLADGPAAFRKIDYEIQEGRFLYGEKALFDYTPTENEDPPTQVVAEFRQCFFRFMGRDEQNAAVWLDEWKIGMGVPIAVFARIDNNEFVVRMANR
jgi:general secretion pathway protein J